MTFFQLLMQLLAGKFVQEEICAKVILQYGDFVEIPEGYYAKVVSIDGDEFTVTIYFQTAFEYECFLYRQSTPFTIHK